jgi:hypothetical protein
VRLPLFYELTDEQATQVAQHVLKGIHSL